METSGKRVHTKNVFDQTRLLIPEMPTWRKTKQAGPRFQRIQRRTLIGNAGWDRAGIRCNCTYQEDCECFDGSARGLFKVCLSVPLLMKSILNRLFLKQRHVDDDDDGW